MNEDYSDIYDTILKTNTEKGTDPQEEHAAPLYEGVLEDVGTENDLYATRLESQEYDYLSLYVSKSDEATPISLGPEEDGYLLPDEAFSEPQEVGDVSVGDSHSPSQDPEPTPWEPQEMGRTVKKEVPSLLSFRVQHSKVLATSQDSPTCLSAAIGLEENTAASNSPEIFLFVKVRLSLTGTPTQGEAVRVSFCFVDQGTLVDQGTVYDVLASGSPAILQSRDD